MEVIEMRRRISSAHKVRQIEIVYELVQDNGYYGIECYSPGNIETGYCYYHSISNSLRPVRELFRLLYRHGVRPLHVADVMEDYYTY